MDVALELRAALDRAADGLSLHQLTVAAEGLMQQYRGATRTDRPVLRDQIDVAAYAVYRMPATFEAVRSALGELARLNPGWRPASLLDLGGGTGAAAWAAAATWPELERCDIVDWAEPALDLGRVLARNATAPGLRKARWLRRSFDDRSSFTTTTADLATADLATASYVLGEVRPAARTALIGELLARAGVVAVVEPGTPAGYRRVLEVRDQMIAAGWHIAAPCPHDGRCPLDAERDWCHFAARVSRSNPHRRVKGATLAYEDEKFSYVIATKDPLTPAVGRILRHPQRRTRLVELTVCTRDDGVVRAAVPKSHGTEYRLAKEASWGDAWPAE